MSSSETSQPAPTQPALTDKSILLGVSGGIAAYKSAELVRRLREQGASVRVVMTAGAQAFVTPLTFQALSGQPVHTDLLDRQAEAAMGHIELARWADLVLVAPATANLLARLRYGLADDLLSTLCLATAAPVCVAPAMNAMMWANPATQDNITALSKRGVELLGPAAGEQACGEVGLGRMLDPADLVTAVASRLATSDALAGARVIVTAGPTYEDLDPVRYLGNRSSGKMGFAIATAARRAGAKVTLLAGPVSVPTPPQVDRIDVRSARQMLAAVEQRLDHCDIYISAAAIADFRPRVEVSEKIKKTGAERVSLELERNPDILTTVAAKSDGPFTVGFAAETSATQANAAAKLASKRLDMICANRVGAADSGFDADHNALTVIWEGGQQQLPRTSKRELADQLIKLIAQRWSNDRQQRKQARWNEQSA